MTAPVLDVFVQSPDGRQQKGTQVDDHDLDLDDLRVRVRENIGLHLEGHRGVDKVLRHHVYQTAADAAVDAVRDFLAGDAR